MSEYSGVKIGKLVLKGEEKRKHKKRKHRVPDSEIIEETRPEDIDTVNHGGWRVAQDIGEIAGPVAIEFGKQTYVRALDNGLFILGAPHRSGEGPDPQEIFTAISAGPNQVAFKSGYNKYMKIENDGLVTGRSEAIGAMEKWEPVFQDNKMALQSHLEFFMSICSADDACVATRKSATDREICQIRFKYNPQEMDDTLLNGGGGSVTKSVNYEEINEKGNLTDTEKAYIRKYQKFQDKKLRVNSSGIHELKRARLDGNLHEKLLDRRSKMKADRYCK